MPEFEMVELMWMEITSSGQIEQSCKMHNHAIQHVFMNQVIECFKMLSHLKCKPVITLHKHKVCEMAKGSLRNVAILVFAYITFA